jgi:uncharacterized protein YbjT (DUF2867 family)
MESMRIAVVGATGRLGRPTVDALRARGHDVVEISRSKGIDVIARDGLAEALAGVDVVIDAASTPTPDEEAAREFFATASRNLQEVGARAGVRRIVVVSIIGVDRFVAGYQAAKVAQERAALEGPIPVTIVRAAQFHEFVGTLADWGRQGDVSYVWPMRTQLVAATSVAEVLADVATDPEPPAYVEVAGPREERLVEAARLLMARRGESVRVEEAPVPSGPDQDRYTTDALLPNSGALLVGPTFETWLDEAA